MAKAISGPKVPFFISYGTENYFLDKDIELARSWSNRVLHFVDGSDKLDDAELVQILETPNSDGLPRTVIVDDAHKMKETKDKVLRAYVEETSISDTTCVLFAVIRGEKLPELWAHIGKKGTISERKELKTWDNNNEVVKYIQTRGLKLGLTYDDGVPDTLFKYTGGDLYRINNELQKLKLLLGGSGKVTTKHLVLVIAPSPKAEPHDVVNAAFAKNKLEAMNSLSTLYKSNGEQASVTVTYSLMRELQKVITARHLLDGGASEDDVATVIGMNPWRCKRYFLPSVRKHDQKALASHMSRLCKLDSDVKGSSRSKRTLVELAVLSIAG